MPVGKAKHDATPTKSTREHREGAETLRTPMRKWLRDWVSEHLTYPAPGDCGSVEDRQNLALFELRV